ncbi:hypothetical protein ACFY0B_03320, partial [Streptomyces sp. NPDC001797]|uniref:hypothetical protein n=1 Tax=Streptomyces sp. NPDC001797 TaxID=3364610 RepID=UPI00368B2B16
AELQRQAGTDHFASLAAAVAPLARSAAELQRQAGTDHFASLAAAVAPLARSAAELQRQIGTDHFAQSLLDLVDTSLQGLGELAQATGGDEIVSGDLPDETINEIEEALSGFEDAVRGLPPAVVRRLWISWVQVAVFALCLQALILLPATAEVMALMGSGALQVAQQAGIAAAKVWDKYHAQPASDTSEED